MPRRQGSDVLFFLDKPNGGQHILILKNGHEAYDYNT